MRTYLEAMDASDYQGPKPEQPLTRVLGALRPPMLQLAATHADGAHPYLVTPEHTARAREILGPGKLLAPEHFVLLERDAGEARRFGRDALALYMTLPNYTENLRLLGFDEADWHRGASDRLVDALVAWGDESAIQARVKEHLDAGADHVAVQPVGRRTGDIGLDQLRALAPALCEL
jgi:probable F420-dependent oxidoreductase